MSAHNQDAERETTTWQALTHGRTLFTWLMFSIFASMVYISIDYEWPANFLPYVMGIPGMALCLLQVVLDVREFHAVKGVVDPRTDFERYMDEISKHTSMELDLDIAKETVETIVVDEDMSARSRGQREIILFGYFFFLLAIVLLLGFWIGIGIFLFVFLRYQTKEPLNLSLMITGGVWSSMYLVLVVVLEQILFEGFITKHIIETYFTD
jgi:hypothetical protein